MNAKSSQQLLLSVYKKRATIRQTYATQCDLRTIQFTILTSTPVKTSNLKTSVAEVPKKGYPYLLSIHLSHSRVSM